MWPHFKTFFYAPPKFLMPLLICLATLQSWRLCNFFPLQSLGVSYTDSSVFLLVGRGIAAGKVPYADLFDHKGPLLYWINYLGDAVWPYRGVGILELLALGLTIFLLYLTLKQLVCPVAVMAGIVVFPVALFYYILGGNFCEEYALPAIAYGIYFLVKVSDTKQITWYEAFLLGLALSWVMLLRINMVAIFPVAMAAALYVLIAQHRYRAIVFSAGAGLLGMLLILLPFLYFFYRHNALADFYYGNIGFNLEYVDSAGGKEILARLFQRLMNPYNFVFSFPLAAGALLAVWQRKNKVFIWFLWIAALLFALTSLMHKYYFEHYGIPNVVLFSLYAGLAANECEKWNWGRLWRVALPLCLYCYITSGQKLEQRRYDTSSANGICRDTMALIAANHLRGSKLLVLGNECKIYLDLGVVPDEKYFYQRPLAEVNQAIFEELKNRLRRQDYDGIIVPDAERHSNLAQTALLSYEPLLQNGAYQLLVRKKFLEP